MTQTIREEAKIAQSLYRKAGDTGLSIKEQCLLTSLLSKYGNSILTMVVR